MSQADGCLASHLRVLVETLCRGLVEREQAVRVGLLAALAGENVLLLGPPGTAKSVIARRIAHAFQGSRPFQYLLTRFTTPDELFGPVSLRQLKEHDAFRRKTEGYLATAEVAFLDEVFKASSAILNALLTLINERLFFNGSELVQVPLLALLAASNETPEDDALLALFDRFSVRLRVERISSEQNFLAMLTSTEPKDLELPEGLALSPDSVRRLRKASQEIRLPPSVQQLLARVKADVEALGRETDAQPHPEPYRFYVSDRRWRQALRLLRMSAYVQGRDEVDAVDCALLQHCLWNRLEDAGRIRALLDRAFECFPVALDLHLEDTARRWWELLQEMRNQPGVAWPFYSGYMVEAGEQCLNVSDREMEAWRGGDPAWIFKSGMAFDPSSGCFRLVSRYPDASLRTQGGTRIPDEPTLRRLLQQGERLLLQEIQAVKVTQRQQPGALLRFEQLHAAVQRHWVEEVRQLHQQLAEQMTAHDSAARRLEEQVKNHLFVQPEQVRGLQLGLAHAGLVLDEWQRKLTRLQAALEERGQYPTPDIDMLSAESEQPEPWRRLLEPVR